MQSSPHVLRSSSVVQPQVPIRVSQRHRTARNVRIEALRLLAILGISIFHTFQPWFAAMVDGLWTPHPLTSSALGLISLLGAFGNHVFFLISGYFLISSATREAQRSAPQPGQQRTGYWQLQARKTGRRALSIAATVAFYAVLALIVSYWITPLEGITLAESGWLLGGLEFIWVYLVLIVCTPVVGWLWARVKQPRRIVSVLAVIVFAINAYIAFISPGNAERGLLEWRKLMSAVTYLASFLVGGALSGRVPSRSTAARGAALCLVTCGLIEFVAAFAGRGDLLSALSFKSTSVLSFALALSAVAYAASEKTPTAAAGEPGKNGASPATTTSHRPAPEGSSSALQGLVLGATSSILGFYVAQSFFRELWQPLMDAATTFALSAGGEAACILAGIMASTGLLAAMLLLDRFTRALLLRRLYLS